MARAADSPFIADEAIYDIVECTSCVDEISVGSVMLGVKIQSALTSQDNGKTTNWYHVKCFFEKYQPKDVHNIDGFEFLSRRAQAKIEALIESSTDDSESSFANTSRTSNGDANMGNYKLNATNELSRSCPNQHLSKLLKEKLNVSGLSTNDDDDDDDDDDNDPLDFVIYDFKSKPKSKEISVIELESESESDANDEDFDENMDNGRRNIRQIKSVQDLDQKTQKVFAEEEARRKRLAERQAMLTDIFDVQDLSFGTVKRLVLDYDVKEAEELVTVNPTLLKKLKLHQMRGVKFMWDSCFESLEQVKKGKGGGCILAHCMGLGKTL